MTDGRKCRSNNYGTMNFSIFLLDFGVYDILELILLNVDILVFLVVVVA